MATTSNFHFNFEYKPPNNLQKDSTSSYETEYLDLANEKKKKIQPSSLIDASQRWSMDSKKPSTTVDFDKLLSDLASLKSQVFSAQSMSNSSPTKNGLDFTSSSSLMVEQQEKNINFDPGQSVYFPNGIVPKSTGVQLVETSSNQNHHKPIHPEQNFLKNPETNQNSNKINYSQFMAQQFNPAPSPHKNGFLTEAQGNRNKLIVEFSSNKYKEMQENNSPSKPTEYPLLQKNSKKLEYYQTGTFDIDERKLIQEDLAKAYLSLNNKNSHTSNNKHLQIAHHSSSTASALSPKPQIEKIVVPPTNLTNDKNYTIKVMASHPKKEGLSASSPRQYYPIDFDYTKNILKQDSSHFEANHHYISTDNKIETSKRKIHEEKTCDPATAKKIGLSNEKINSNNESIEIAKNDYFKDEGKKNFIDPSTRRDSWTQIRTFLLPEKNKIDATTQISIENKKTHDQSTEIMTQHNTTEVQVDDCLLYAKIDMKDSDSQCENAAKIDVGIETSLSIFKDVMDVEIQCCESMVSTFEKGTEVDKIEIKNEESSTDLTGAEISVFEASKQLAKSLEIKNKLLISQKNKLLLGYKMFEERFNDIMTQKIESDQKFLKKLSEAKELQNRNELLEEKVSLAHSEKDKALNELKHVQENSDQLLNILDLKVKRNDGLEKEITNLKKHINFLEQNLKQKDIELNERIMRIDENTQNFVNLKKLLEEKNAAILKLTDEIALKQTKEIDLKSWSIDYLIFNKFQYLAYEDITKMSEEIKENILRDISRIMRESPIDFDLLETNENNLKIPQNMVIIEYQKDMKSRDFYIQDLEAKLLASREEIKTLYQQLIEFKKLFQKEEIRVSYLSQLATAQGNSYSNNQSLDDIYGTLNNGALSARGGQLSSRNQSPVPNLNLSRATTPNSKIKNQLSKTLQRLDKEDDDEDNYNKDEILESVKPNDLNYANGIDNADNKKKKKRRHRKKKII